VVAYYALGIRRVAVPNTYRFVDPDPNRVAPENMVKKLRAISVLYVIREVAAAANQSNLEFNSVQVPTAMVGRH
jgi:hypothetical protein